jgi:hypothetical protein
MRLTFLGQRRRLHRLRDAASARDQSEQLPTIIGIRNQAISPRKSCEKSFLKSLKHLGRRRQNVSRSGVRPKRRRSVRSKNSGRIDEALQSPRKVVNERVSDEDAGRPHNDVVVQRPEPVETGSIEFKKGINVGTCGGAQIDEKPPNPPRHRLYVLDSSYRVWRWRKCLTNT